MDDTLDLREYLAVLRRRRWLIVAVVLVTVAVAIGVSLVQTPVYEAEAELVIEPVRRSDDAALQDLILGDAVVETEQRVLTSRTIADRVIDELGLQIAPDELSEDVSASTVRDTRVITLRASSTDPVEAAAIANAYVENYLDYRRDRAVSELVAAQDELDRRAADLRSQIDAIESQIASAGEADTSALEAERQSLLTQLAQVSAQAIANDNAANLVRGGGEVLTPAEVPDSPASPRPARTGVLAAVLGLMLGVGLAFLRDYLDDTVRDEDDLKRVGAGVPVIGRIPHVEEGQDRLVTLVQPSAHASEAYRALGTNVRFLSAPAAIPDGDPTVPPRTQMAVVFVTSAQPGEGKTSTAANLAVVAAKAGRRTVLLDADMRRPTIAQRLGMGSAIGLSEILAGTARLREVLVPIDDSFYALPSGVIPPNPAELLAMPAFRGVLDELARGGTQLVVIDTPPVLVVPDALEIARIATLGLLVAKSTVSSRRAIGAALERLAGVDAPIRGLVLNDIAAGDGTLYEYYYRYEDDSTPRQTAPGNAPTPDAAAPPPAATPAPTRPAAPASNGAPSAPTPDNGETLFGAHERTQPAPDDAAEEARPQP